jgi:hypothetical protein
MNKSENDELVSIVKRYDDQGMIVEMVKRKKDGTFDVIVNIK